MFESGVLIRKCDIAEEKIEGVMRNLRQLRVVNQSDCIINGEKRTLYSSCPGHELIALFLIAREIGYAGAYSLQSHLRNTPFLK
jgi:hypothetical protein